MWQEGYNSYIYSLECCKRPSQESKDTKKEQTFNDDLPEFTVSWYIVVCSGYLLQWFIHLEQDQNHTRWKQKWKRRFLKVKHEDGIIIIMVFISKPDFELLSRPRKMQSRFKSLVYFKKCMKFVVNLEFKHFNYTTKDLSRIAQQDYFW